MLPFRSHFITVIEHKLSADKGMGIHFMENQQNAIKYVYGFLIIKPTRYTNFSNLFLEWNSTCFGQFLCPSSGVFHCTHSNGICHIHLLTARKLSANLYDIYHCCVYSEKPPDDGQSNCPKHVKFYSKNKFEKLVHLVGFIIRIYHDTRSPERQKRVRKM